MKKTQNKILSFILSLAFVVTSAGFGAAPVYAVTAACEMNGSPYSSVSAALSDVTTSSPAAITLLKDCSANVEIQNNQNITIDLNGYTLTSATTGSAILINRTGGNLTVKNGTISGGYSSMNGGAVINYADMKIYDVVFSDNSANSAGGAIENSGALDIYSSEFSDNYAGGSGGAIYNSGTLNIYNTDFTDNSAYVGGGAIINNNVLNIYSSELSDNISLENGGAIKNNSVALLYNVTIEGNSAICGGGISTNPKLVLMDTDITGNSANQAGGGIYAAFSGCFAPGTKVTMADGSKKNVEDIKDGDLVRTFDHETGTLSSERVCYTYKGDTVGQAYTLHFTNGVDVKIVAGHDFLERDSKKYVVIAPQTIDRYIGKYFYNANAGRWEQLLGMTVEDETPYYAFYTANHLNCITDDMLTVNIDAKWLLNIFDMDDSLKFDAAKKQADIDKYGLASVEDLPYATAQTLADFNYEYTYIGIGKGLLTEDEALAARVDAYYYYRAKEAQPMVLGSMAPKPGSFTGGAALPKIDDYSSNTGNIIIGDDVIVSGNVNTSNNDQDDNIYLTNGLIIEILDSSDGIEAGVTLIGGSGAFTNNGAESDVNQFFSDSELYAVKFTADHLELVPHTHEWSYGASGNTITATCGGDGSCRPTEGRELKISAADASCDGNPHGAVVTPATIAGCTTIPAIVYEGIGSTVYAASESAPTFAGTYRASITLQSTSGAAVTAFADYSIADTTTEYEVVGDSRVQANGLSELADFVKADGNEYCDVKIVLSANSTTETSQNSSQVVLIKELAKSGLLELLDIDLKKYINGATTGSPITNTPNIVEVVVPFDTNGKSGITVYRYHEGEVVPVTRFTRIRTTSAPSDGTFYIENNAIHIFSNKFSLYAIGYDMSTGGDVDNSPVKPAAKKLPFVDVAEGAYYYDAVCWSVDNGITSGTDDTHFSPAEITNRAQMVTLLWRAVGKPQAVNRENPFTDVSPNSYCYEAVLWGVENGVVKGTTITTFSPNQDVTRGQAVAFLARFAGVDDKASGYSHSFADVKTSKYYSNAVAWAASNGITSGKTKTLFGPDDSCQRAHIVQFLYNYFTK